MKSTKKPKAPLSTPRKQRASPARKKQLTPWKNTKKCVSGYQGFVYLITNLLTGRKYIGRKYLWKTLSRKKPGAKRRIRSVVESDWATYTGSCNELNRDIATMGLDKFEFVVLDYYETRGKTNYAEVKEQFSRDVLFSKIGSEFEYYNTNILNRYFRGRV